MTLSLVSIFALMKPRRCVPSATRLGRAGTLPPAVSAMKCNAVLLPAWAWRRCWAVSQSMPRPRSRSCGACPARMPASSLLKYSGGGGKSAVSADRADRRPACRAAPEHGLQARGPHALTGRRPVFHRRAWVFQQAASWSPRCHFPKIPVAYPGCLSTSATVTSSAFSPFESTARSTGEFDPLTRMFTRRG